MQHALSTGPASLGELIDRLTTKARSSFGSNEIPRVVVSPYRFNPLGAHIDHQGGQVLARTLNQYSIGAFFSSKDSSVCVEFASFAGSRAEFELGELPSGENWQRYAMAAA